MHVLAGNSGESEALRLMQAVSKRPNVDPPLFFNWGTPGVAELVARMNDAGAAALPGAFGPLPLDETSFKQRLVRHVQATYGGGGIIGEALGISGNIVQCANVAVGLVKLQSEPWMMDLLGDAPLPAPLAHVYTPRPNSRTGACTALTIDSRLFA